MLSLIERKHRPPEAWVVCWRRCSSLSRWFDVFIRSRNFTTATFLSLDLGRPPVRSIFWLVWALLSHRKNMQSTTQVKWRFWRRNHTITLNMVAFHSLCSSWDCQNTTVMTDVLRVGKLNYFFVLQWETCINVHMGSFKLSPIKDHTSNQILHIRPRWQISMAIFFSKSMFHLLLSAELNEKVMNE